MSSFFLRPVPNETDQQNSFWSEDLRQLWPFDEEFGGIIFTSTGRKHISLQGDMLVYREVIPLPAELTAEPTVGEVRGIARISYSKMIYGERKVFDQSVYEESGCCDCDWADSSKYDRTVVLSRQHKKPFFLTLHSSPNEEITETLYFDDKESLNEWKKRLSRVPVMHVNFHTKYSLQKRMGHGGFSRIYLVKNSEDEELYIAKVIENAKVSRTEPSRNHLLNEIDIMNEINGIGHSPSLHEVHFSEERLYLIMQFIDGRNLEQLMDERKKTGRPIKILEIMT
jgi:hypothetical protein